jgi:hypothetical protein
LNKVNHIDSCNDAPLVRTRPLFSSAWLALFNVLRKNYNERHFTDAVRPETLKAADRKQQRLN